MQASSTRLGNRLPITVLIAAKNEEANLPKCLGAVSRAESVVVLDSNSTDQTTVIAESYNAKVVQFEHQGGYPKKRQWALENLPISTPWVLLLDADEVVPERLWKEIEQAIAEDRHAAFLIRKGFHFLGKRMKFGGFSHQAVLLIRTGKGKFERLVEFEGDSFDMEVHERVIVEGSIGRLKTPLIHEDFKGLEAYIERHNKYSSWEARLRYRLLMTGHYGQESVRAKFWGNVQERRRWLKRVIIRLPFEPTIWFVYHYILRLAFLDGRRGLIASSIRAQYIQNVRAKIIEINQDPRQ